MATTTTTTSSTPIADCLSCRLVGTAAFAGIGVYAIAAARHYGANKAISAGPGAIWGIRLVGYAFIAAAAGRWTVPLRASKDVEKE